MGAALGVRQSPAATLTALLGDFEQIAAVLQATRPTAVNLAWALERMRRRLAACTGSVAEARHALEQEALAIHADDIARNRMLGRH
ncbi:MAG: S-methyl-5-thioribose-1-phosphate isomerase, partial [Gemmataceae bacterium]